MLEARSRDSTAAASPEKTFIKRFGLAALLEAAAAALWWGRVFLNYR